MFGYFFLPLCLSWPGGAGPPCPGGAGGPVVVGVDAVAVVVVVVVVEVVAVDGVLELELELELLLGVDRVCDLEEADDPRAGAGAEDRDELDVLEPPPVLSAYATAAPSRSSATAARKAHGPAPRERLGGMARVGAVGSGGTGGRAAACGTVAICGTSAAAAAAAITVSDTASGLVGSVAVSKLARRSRTSAAV